MDPWRLGTTYDRPIARRIAEEAGPTVPWGTQRHAQLAPAVLGFELAAILVVERITAV